MAASLAGKIALITAGSAGLGAATARAFAALNMRVVINYSSNSDRAEALVKELYQSAGTPEDGNKGTSKEKRFIAIKADVSSRSEITRLVQETVSDMGGIDVVFSNHGWTRLTNFNNLDENVEDVDWDRCFNMNVKSHLYLMHATKQYLDISSGAFITTSSVAGVKAAGSSLVSLVSTSTGMFNLLRLLGATGVCRDQGSADPSCKMSCWNCKPQYSCQLCISRDDDHG